MKLRPNLYAWMSRSTHLECATVIRDGPNPILKVTADPDPTYRALLGAGEINYVGLNNAEKKEVKDFFWPPDEPDTPPETTAGTRKRSRVAGSSSTDPVNL